MFGADALTADALCPAGWRPLALLAGVLLQPERTDQRVGGVCVHDLRGLCAVGCDIVWRPAAHRDAALCGKDAPARQRRRCECTRRIMLFSDPVLPCSQCHSTIKTVVHLDGRFCRSASMLLISEASAGMEEWERPNGSVADSSYTTRRDCAVCMSDANSQRDSKLTRSNLLAGAAADLHTHTCSWSTSD